MTTNLIDNKINECIEKFNSVIKNKRISKKVVKVYTILLKIMQIIIIII